MYLTDSDAIKICWYWPDTDTDTRIGAALCINTLEASIAGVTLSIMWLWLSCVITRSRLQLINTSIITFFSELCAFLVEQRRRKASDG